MNKTLWLKYIRQNKYLLLFIVFAASGWLFNHWHFNLHSPEELVQHINLVLFEKEQKADLVTDTMMHQIRNNTFTRWINENNENIDDFYKEQGLAYYVYDQNRLIYWTNNAIAIPEDTLWHQARFKKLGNTYAEIRTRKYKQIEIIALIQIKSGYPFENEFLKNKFHPSFNINCPFLISIDEQNPTNQIRNKEGEYLFSLYSDNTCKKKDSIKLSVTFLLIGLFFLLLFGRDKFKNTRFTPGGFILFSAILIILRVLAQITQAPDIFHSMAIFKPEYFACSHLFPSLGDLLITVTLVVYLVFVFYSKVNLAEPESSNKTRITILWFIWTLVIVAYALAGQFIFTHLLIDSNFQYEAYDVLNLSLFSFIGYFILISIFIGFILLIDKAIIQIKNVTSFPIILKIILIASAIGLVVILAGHYQKWLVSFLFFMTILTYWFRVRLKSMPRFGTVIILIALFSVYATYFIRKQNFVKRIEESKVLAVNLAREQDPVAEVIIAEMMEQVQSDTIIKDFLQQEWFSFDELVNYIQSKYFTGYLGRYNFQLMLCNSGDSVLLDETTNEWAHCYTFFKNLLDANATETNIPGLYHLKNINGGINYFVKNRLSLDNGWDDVTLFLELTSKPNFEVLGYPKLLLEKPLGLYGSYTNLSFAKYSGTQLIEQTGDFPYAFDRSVYGFPKQEFTFFQTEGYDHLLYHTNSDNSVLVSFPTIKFYNIVISFTYIFLFLLFQATVLLIIGNRFAHIVEIKFNIKNKIVYSLLLILLISLFIVGSGTIFYTFRQFERGQNEILAEKLQSVLIEIEHKLADVQNIQTISPDYLTSLLVKFSNVFYTDINMYDKQGDLLATSRNEIFNKKLTSTRMNAEAYRELVLNKKAKVVHKENIGKLEYYSAYVPFLSSERQLLAYINLPYFAKEVVFRQELMRVVVAIINIYAFLIILGIGVAVYMSNRITEPLRMLQQRIRNIDLSRQNERISYAGDDEIAELVLEYNRMLDELDKSAKLLAKSERESAWREMAQQIAHEIKNPLTPMKLSTQLLERSWENKDADFNERLQRFTSNLIEQIDSLSSIATAFSQFAQMPHAQAQKVNLTERILQSSELFKECSYVDFGLRFDKNKPVYVKADNERMLQVFNNLVKNAIQAIPKENQGKINISIKQNEDAVVVEIQDNGVGVSSEMKDKLFQPNFTTKSSGTGLGLAIVKNIVEEFGGSIWFETQEGKGSTFFVSLPVFREETKE